MDAIKLAGTAYHARLPQLKTSYEGGPNSYTGADLRTRTGTGSPRWLPCGQPLS